VKVIIESNLQVKDQFEPPMELSIGEDSTLRGLLVELSERNVSANLLDEKGRLAPDIDELTINDKDFFTLKKGLNTRLNDGDRIRFQIQMVQIGGG
jgi:hypothetical protein